MSNLVLVYLLSAVAGVAGGVAAVRRRASGVLALALCLVPIAGLGAMAVFC